MFKTVDNTKGATGIEIIITLEEDKKDESGSKWQATQEHLLSEDELEHDKSHGLD